MKTHLNSSIKTVLLLAMGAVLLPVFAAQPPGSTNTATNAAKPATMPIPRRSTNPPVVSTTVIRTTTTTNVTPAGVSATTVRTTATTNVATAVPAPPTAAAIPATAVPALPAPPVPPAPKMPSTIPAAVAPTVPPPAAVAPTIPPPAAVAPTAAKPEKEDVIPLLNFDKMPLAQMLDVYSELVGRTVLRATTLPVDTFQITFKARGPLTKSEAITALETVMAMNGFTVVPVGEKFVKVIPGPEAGTAGGEFSNQPAKDLPVAGRFVTQIVQLKYVPVQDAVTAITPFASNKTGASIVPIPTSQTIVLRDYSENMKRMMEVIDKIDVVSELEVKPEVIPIKYALASDIAQVLGSLTASGPGMSVGKSSHSGLSGGGTGSYTPGSTGTTMPGAQPNPMGSSSMSSGSIGSRSSFQSRLESIVKRASSAGEFQILGETKIIADERTNSLLIFANAQDMVMIKTIIGQLDVVLAQVLIEAIIMDVELTSSRDMGISYLQRPKALGNGITGAGGVNNKLPAPFLNPSKFVTTSGSNNTASAIGIDNLTSGFSYFTTMGKSGFDIAVQLAEGDNRAHILSRPSIQTSHAVEARLFVGKTVPYVTGTYNYGYGSGPSAQYQQKEVGIALNVLPLINPDGLVVMDIQQNIEQLAGTQTIAGVGDVPITTKREAAAKVAVRDRETVVLGGFINTQKNKNRSGVPYLRNIPLLGALFRSNHDDTDRSELMVFLRPTVLPTPEAAAIAAQDEKDKLPGVKQGEYEIREEERKRNEAIEEEMRKKMGLKAPKKSTH